MCNSVGPVLSSNAPQWPNHPRAANVCGLASLGAHRATSKTHLPSTCIILCLNLEAAELMHRQLLTLLTRGKKGTARQRIGCKFRLAANPPWRHMSFARLLPDLAGANHAKLAEGKDLRYHERVLPQPRPMQLLLTCPKPSCGATKDCARCLLHFKTAFKPVKCTACHSSPSSARW